MAKKCTVCGGKVDITFLQKPLGTYIRDEKGKKHLVCRACQKQHTLDEIREKL